jgi:hypothetical protein
MHLRFLQLRSLALIALLAFFGPPRGASATAPIQAPSNVIILADGKARPAPGYRFANDTPGDLTVVRVGPSEQQIQTAGTSIVLGLLANAVAQQEPEDFFDMIVIEAARVARDQLVLNALTNLFSNLPKPQLQAAARLIVLAADGRLTAKNWQSQQVIDGIKARLQASSPEAAQTFEVAQFIGAVVSSYQNRR